MDIAPTLNAAETSSSLGTHSFRWGPWATLVWGVPLTLTAILFQSLGALGFVKWWRFVHPGEPIALASLASHGAVLAFALAASAPLVLALLGYAVRLSGFSLSEYLALKWPRWRDIGVGFAALAAVLFGVGLIAGIAGQESPEFMAETYNTARAAGMLPLLFVSFVLLAPLQEELLFRGFFFRGFAPALGVWPAIVATSAAWALTHVQYQWFFMGEIFALGVVLGWLRARSGSTILTIALHATINGVALLEVGFLAES